MAWNLESNNLGFPYISLRSKRFQSSYCAKVRAGAKKKVKGVIPFFLLSSKLSRQTREETLATQATLTFKWSTRAHNKRNIFRHFSCCLQFPLEN